jgi:prepilin-type N-terminal cleavage/methylation domain-containing protein
MKKFTKYSRGFTLIELLVVIAIIGILSAIVLASLSTARSKGKDAAMEEQMSGARSQMEIYASSNGNSYASGCASSTANNGLGGTSPYTGIIGGIMSDVGSAVTFTPNGTGVSSATTAVCHDSSGAWAMAVPLNGALPGGAYWCVDNAGDSKADAGLSTATTYLCP